LTNTELYHHAIFTPISARCLRYGDFTISNMGPSAILNFRGPIMGSSKSPCRTCYRSSIETIAINCLVFEKIAFLCTHFGDRQTNGWTESMRKKGSCCRERHLNNLSSYPADNQAHFATLCL